MKTERLILRKIEMSDYEATLKSRVINKMGEREDVSVYVSICEKCLPNVNLHM